MSHRKLSIGTSGEDVRAVQQALNEWGANPRLECTGKFTSATDAAVRAFQARYGLAVDGVVGKDTRRALFPIGVATTTIVGLRLRLPKLQIGPARAHGLSLGIGPLTLQPPPPGPVETSYLPKRFPLLSASIAAPVVPDWRFDIPPLPGVRTPPLLDFDFDHIELAPGAQRTVASGAPPQDAFVLTIQNVYRRGPDDDAHQEAALGMQLSAPANDPNGPWTFNAFVQLTDVDRFGALGKFHWWQPYASAGAQFTGRGDPKPALTANVVPINLALDVNDVLTLNLLGLGGAFVFDLNSRQMQAGAQLTTGITVKFGSATSPF